MSDKEKLNLRIACDRLIAKAEALSLSDREIGIELLKLAGQFNPIVRELE